ncbi:MAG: antibiotic biosynthesis monooxygenase [Chloroflexota bacterium]|nr:antibiotic biosynthesis monooxygenase [Chloroflexota bacterium]
MYGMIARATVKPGQAAALQALLADWRATVRPTVPGSFLELVGNIAGHTDQVVFVALAQDQAAWDQLAASPEQLAFYQKFNAVFTAEPTWETVSMEITIQDER